MANIAEYCRIEDCKIIYLVFVEKRVLCLSCQPTHLLDEFSKDRRSKNQSPNLSLVNVEELIGVGRSIGNLRAHPLREGVVTDS